MCNWEPDWKNSPLLTGKTSFLSVSFLSKCEEMSFVWFFFWLKTQLFKSFWVRMSEYVPNCSWRSEHTSHFWKFPCSFCTLIILGMSVLLPASSFFISILGCPAWGMQSSQTVPLPHLPVTNVQNLTLMLLLKLLLFFPSPLVLP